MSPTGDKTRGKFHISLNLANSAQMKDILNIYNLSPSDDTTKERQWDILQFSNQFQKDFKQYKADEISATFSNDDKLLELSTTDGKVSLPFKQGTSTIACTACNTEVCNGTSKQGQGLQCANCEGWFHNQCTSSPLSVSLFQMLADSPIFLKVFCPNCMANNCVSQRQLFTELQALKHEFVNFKTSLNFEFLESNIIKQILSHETINSCKSDLQDTVDTISETNKGMQNALTNSLSSVESAVDQMVTSAQRLNNLDIADMSTTFNKSISDMSNMVNDNILCDETVEKLSNSVASKLIGNPDFPDLLDSMKPNSAKAPVKRLMSQIVSQSNEASSTSTTGTVDLSNSSAQRQQKGSNTPNQISKQLCDENKTVAIDNITNYFKFIRSAKDTKKEFNTHFPGMRIVHTKGTRRGTLLIELTSPKDAEKVILNWKPSFFSQDNGENNKTIATLLKDKNCKGVIYHIDHEYSDEYIKEEIEKTASLKKKVTVKRFVKGSSKLSTVLLTFGCKEDLETSLNNGLSIGRSFEDVHLYKPIPKAIRCWKCWILDHPAIWCSKKTKTCPYCAKDHDAKECPIYNKDTQDEEQYYCVNCKEGGKHHSSSNDCPEYLNKCAQAQQYAQL